VGIPDDLARLRLERRPAATGGQAGADDECEQADNALHSTVIRLRRGEHHTAALARRQARRSSGGAMKPRKPSVSGLGGGLLNNRKGSLHYAKVLCIVLRIPRYQEGEDE
jgi:hypothetical protein